MKKSQAVEVPYDYEVIGEHLADPARLLVIGGDGRIYALDLNDGYVTQIELSEQWVVDHYDLRDKIRSGSFDRGARRP